MENIDKSYQTRSLKILKEKDNYKENVFKELYLQAKYMKEVDPAAKSIFEVITLYPGFKIVVNHKIANWLYRKRLFYLARAVSNAETASL